MIFIIVVKKMWPQEKINVLHRYSVLLENEMQKSVTDDFLVIYGMDKVILLNVLQDDGAHFGWR